TPSPCDGEGERGSSETDETFRIYWEYVAAGVNDLWDSVPALSARCGSGDSIAARGQRVQAGCRCGNRQCAMPDLSLGGIRLHPTAITAGVLEELDSKDAAEIRRRHSRGASGCADRLPHQKLRERDKWNAGSKRGDSTRSAAGCTGLT